MFRTFLRGVGMALLAGLLLAGCGQVVRVHTIDEQGTSEPPPPKNRYEAEANLGPEAIANLRATAPPQQTEFGVGKALSTDDDRLGAQGYVRVGTGYYRDPEVKVGAGAIRPAIDQARELGADMALVYAPAAGEDETRVAFYIRMKLPFGATFRDLTPKEHDKVGSDGVQLGSIVGGSPASRANLLPGDIVVKVDGAAVSGRADFQKQLKAKAGRRVSLSLWRDGVSVQREVRLGVPPPH